MYQYSVNCEHGKTFGIDLFVSNRIEEVHMISGRFETFDTCGRRISVGDSCFIFHIISCLLTRVIVPTAVSKKSLIGFVCSRVCVCVCEHPKH